MTAQCQHNSVTQRQDDTWLDTNGKPHTVLIVTCRICGKKRVKQTGDDTPYRMPPVHWRMKP